MRLEINGSVLRASDILFVCFLLILLGCSTSEELRPTSSNQTDTAVTDTVLTGGGTTSGSCSSVVAEGKFYKHNGQTFLWGGTDQRTHFNISNWSLSECNLFFGLGREHFQVPNKSEFDKMADVVDDFDDIEKVILLRSSSVTKIYPYKILVQPEMVNDIIDGQPIMVVYCFLADLAAVYSRVYDNRTLTFAVSGYTYADSDISEGSESFILWDRETESLWWPIIDKGVSGNFRDTRMLKHDEVTWEVTRWGDVKDKYPEALILKDVWFQNFDDSDS